MSMRNDELRPVADQDGQPISGLYKSTRTGAMVVKKNEEYERYLREKENHRKMHSLSDEVSELKSEMQEIKDLLKQQLDSNINK